MSSEKTFSKDNLDLYLKELGKAFRKVNGKSMRAEIIMIGGAAILVNYGFRSMTTDVDAIICASSAMKEAINLVADQFGLQNGWLNTDFMRTDSYSAKLVQFSKFYRTYSGILDVRTVSAEYLVAMKLKSGRAYKHDRSDIVGILAEHEKNGSPISLDSVRSAVTDLYGSWDCISQEMREFIENTYAIEDLSCLYNTVSEEEARSKAVLIEFQHDYPGVTNTANVDDILSALKKKQQSPKES